MSNWIRKGICNKKINENIINERRGKNDLLVLKEYFLIIISLIVCVGISAIIKPTEYISVLLAFFSGVVTIIFDIYDWNVYLKRSKNTIYRFVLYIFISIVIFFIIAYFIKRYNEYHTIPSNLSNIISFGVILYYVISLFRRNIRIFKSKNN